MFQILRTRQIVRRKELSRERFYGEYLSGAGIPVVITDAMDSWAARAKWDFDFFRKSCGDDTVMALGGMSSRAAKIMKVRDYIDYAERPAQGARGLWIDPASSTPLTAPLEPLRSPLYVYTWNPFIEHPELLDDLHPSPYFVDDWLPLLPRDLQTALCHASPAYYSLLIGPEGTRSAFHQHSGWTHAYLAQLRGRKKCYLVSPDHSEAIAHGRVDPECPDFDKFPRLADATVYDTVLEPGELLFIPAGWWHHVVALEKSIAFSYDFFNRANFGRYVLGLLKMLPNLVAALERTPELRESLGVDWVCRGFEFPDPSRESEESSVGAGQ